MYDVLPTAQSIQSLQMAGWAGDFSAAVFIWTQLLQRLLCHWMANVEMTLRQKCSRSWFGIPATWHIYLVSCLSLLMPAMALQRQ